MEPRNGGGLFPSSPGTRHLCKLNRQELPGFRNHQSDRGELPEDKFRRAPFRTGGKKIK